MLTVHVLGDVQNQGDHTMFYKHANGCKVIVLIVYVGYIILTGNLMLKWKI